MSDRTTRIRVAPAEGSEHNTDGGAGSTVWFCALVLGLILLGLQFIPSPGRPSGKGPAGRADVAPVAVEIKGPEEPSRVLLFLREPSLDEVLGRAGSDSMKENVTSGLGARMTNGSRVEWDETVSNPSISIRPMDAPKRVALGLKIDINHAGLEELTAVPGLTELRAQKIVEYRAEHGAIGQLAELVEKRVLSAKTMHRIRPFVECAL